MTSTRNPPLMLSLSSAMVNAAAGVLWQIRGRVCRGSTPTRSARWNSAHPVRPFDISVLRNTQLPSTTAICASVSSSSWYHAPVAMRSWCWASSGVRAST